MRPSWWERVRGFLEPESATGVAALIGASAVPGVGTAIDVADVAAGIEDRDATRIGIGALAAALPFVAGPALREFARSFGRVERTKPVIPDDWKFESFEEAHSRARAQGYDLDKTYYHFTAPKYSDPQYYNLDPRVAGMGQGFTEFIDPLRRGFIYFNENPDAAQTAAQTHASYAWDEGGGRLAYEMVGDYQIPVVTRGKIFGRPEHVPEWAQIFKETDPSPERVKQAWDQIPKSFKDPVDIPASPAKELSLSSYGSTFAPQTPVPRLDLPRTPTTEDELLQLLMENMDLGEKKVFLRIVNSIKHGDSPALKKDYIPDWGHIEDDKSWPKMLKRFGYDGTLVKDEGDISLAIMSDRMNKVRSRWAQFNPARVLSPSMTAGISGLAAAGAGMEYGRRQREKRRA